MCVHALIFQIYLNADIFYLHDIALRRPVWVILIWNKGRTNSSRCQNQIREVGVLFNDNKFPILIHFLCSKGINMFCSHFLFTVLVLGHASVFFFLIVYYISFCSAALPTCIPYLFLSLLVLKIGFQALSIQFMVFRFLNICGVWSSALVFCSSLWLYKETYELVW